MPIFCISDIAQLEPYRERWDQLAGDCVFRSWSWLSTWWRHYGEGNQLFVLLAFKDTHADACDAGERSSRNGAEQLVAILPCYLETSFVRGRVLRLLGDGEVCSEHLDVLVQTPNTESAAAALAGYLCESTNAWDTTQFTAIGPSSMGLAALQKQLIALGCQVTQDANQHVWSVALPDDWEAFLALQSKSHRKQLRRLEKRVLDTSHAVWHLVQSPSEFEIAWSILIDLHQRRRLSLGQPGCFASSRWADFHRDIARQLLLQGKLRLSWLELAGQPIAAEYQFADSNTTWAYQGGLDPSRLDEEPGRMSMIRTFQQAIAEGHQQFDFLRGDEPYKAHWRAQPRATFDIQIVPARSTALWRSGASNTLQGAARLARQFTNMLGSLSL